MTVCKPVNEPLGLMPSQQVMRVLLDEFGEMSRWAKNASTTTMRIGNAALLKKRLMAGS